MKVADTLASVLAAVCNDAVAVCKSFKVCDLRYGFKDRGDRRRILGGDRVRPRDMLLRDDENVYRSLRVYVAEGVYLIILLDLR